MAAAVAVEDLLAGEGDLHGAARAAGQLRHDDLVVEGIALPAEAAAVGACDDADARRGHPQDLRQRPVEVVGRLRARPDAELPVGRRVGHGGVLLHGEVGAPLVEEEVLPHEVGLGEALLHVSELQGDALVDVAVLAVVVDARLRRRQGLLDGADGGEGPVLHAHGVRRRQGLFLRLRRHRRHGVADVADPVGTERVLVLGDGEDAEGHGQVLPREDGPHAGHRGGGGGVDGEDPRMGVGGAEQLAPEHPRQVEVVGEDRLARHLGRSVHLAVGRADDLALPRRHGPRLPSSPAPCAPRRAPRPRRS